MERDYNSFSVESNKTQLEAVQPTEVIEETKEANNTAEVEETKTNEVADAELSKDEPTEEMNEAPKLKGKSRAQKRIESLIQEKHELSRKLEEANSKSNEVKPKELDPDDFEDYDDYLDAIAEKKPKEVTKEVSNIDDSVSVVEQFKYVTEDMIDKYEDFEDKLSTMPVLTIDMIRVLNESDNVGEVSYYLANHTKIARELSKLSIGKMAIEIGKIEAKLLEPTREPIIQKKTTQAPEPIKPAGGSNMPPRSLAEATTQQEYEAMRKSQTSKSNGFI